MEDYLVPSKKHHLLQNAILTRWSYRPILNGRVILVPDQDTNTKMIVVALVPDQIVFGTNVHDTTKSYFF